MLNPYLTMGISSFFYSLQYLDVKTTSPFFDIWLIIFVRGITSFLICLFLLMILSPSNIFGNQKKLLFIRGIYGTLTIVFSFLSIKYLNLSIATVLSSTGPIFTGIFTCFSKGIWTWKDSISVFLCFIGIIMICIQGFFEKSRNFWIGIFCGLLSSIFSALVNVTISSIKEENAFTITMYSMGLCSLQSLPLMIINFDFDQIFSQDKFRIIQLFCTGISSLIAQYLKTLSIQNSENLGVIVLRYLDTIFCIFWDIFILHSSIHWNNYLGIGFILLGCGINIISFN